MVKVEKGEVYESSLDLFETLGIVKESRWREGEVEPKVPGYGYGSSWRL